MSGIESVAKVATTSNYVSLSTSCDIVKNADISFLYKKHTDESMYPKPTEDFLIVIIFCNAIFGLFFKSLPAAQKFWPKQSLYSGLGELRKSKIDLVDLKKGRLNFHFF